MSGPTASATLKIRGDSTSADRALGGLHKRAGDLGKAVIGVAGAYLGAQGLVSALKAVTAAANTQAEAEVRLAAAIRGSGQAIDAQKIKDYAGELQKLTTFGDEATIEAAALLATFGLTEAQIINLLPRVQNLSAMYGGSLTDSAKLVGRAMTQGASALSRVGVVLDDNTKKAFKNADQTEKVAMLMRTLDANTGDAAEALRKATGAATALSNSYGDLLESFGQMVQEDQQGWFQGLADAIDEVNTALREYFRLSGTQAARELLATDAASAAADIARKVQTTKNDIAFLEGRLRSIGDEDVAAEARRAAIGVDLAKLRAHLAQLQGDLAGVSVEGPATATPGPAGSTSGRRRGRRSTPSGDPPGVVGGITTRSAREREVDAWVNASIVGYTKQHQAEMDFARTQREMAEQQSDWLQQERDSRAAAEESARQAGLERDRQLALERKRLRDDEVAAHMAAEQQKIDATLAFASIAIDASFRVTEALIAGDLRAVASALLGVAKQTGTWLIGSGMRSLADGLALNSNPITAGSGTPAIQTGIGLIGAGIGIGGAATIAGGLLGQVGGGAGGSFGATPGLRSGGEDFSVGSTRRTGVRASQGRDGGLTVVYAGGTIIGDNNEAARATANNLNRAKRRLLMG